MNKNLIWTELPSPFHLQRNFFFEDSQLGSKDIYCLYHYRHIFNLEGIIREGMSTLGPAPFKVKSYETEHKTLLIR